MNAYSEVDAIYFQIGSLTGFAKLINDTVHQGYFIGEPPYKSQTLPFTTKLREYHAAEHKVYNAFMSKNQNLKAEAQLDDLALPSLNEIRKASSFSLMCGSTIYLGSGILLITSALPNLLHYHNLEVAFMIPWLTGALIISYCIMHIIQYQFFLSNPQDYQLELALTALKEAINNAKHH